MCEVTIEVLIIQYIYLLNLTMGELSSSETSVTIYQSTRCNFPQDGNLHLFIHSWHLMDLGRENVMKTHTL
jgi:hypothetical protein